MEVFFIVLTALPVLATRWQNHTRIRNDLNLRSQSCVYIMIVISYIYIYIVTIRMKDA